MPQLRYFSSRNLRLSLLSLSLCSLFTHADTTLQSIENVEQYEITEGNTFRLAKGKQGCKIEAIFFGELGRVKENYIFKQQSLLYAARYEYHYSDGGLTNLSENQGKFSTQQERIELNPKAAATLSDFREYLSLFSRTELKKCV